MSKRRKKDKEIRFDLFRYQILPKTTRQLTLFEREYSVEDLKRSKNDFFKEALLKVNAFFSLSGTVLNHVFNKTDGQIILMLLGPTKFVPLRDKNFKLILSEDHPYVFVLFDNNPSRQVIAISSEESAFSSPFVVANILQRTLNVVLDSYSLEVAINPILDRKDFWELIKKYENRITSLRFDIVKPNLSDITKTIGEDIKGVMNETNSVNAKFELNAPEGRVLENINEDNQDLRSLTDSSVLGASDVTMKIEGIMRPITTNSTVMKIFIKEATIESKNGDISDIIRGLI